MDANKKPDPCNHKCSFSYGVRATCSCGWVSNTWYGKGAQKSAAAEFGQHKQQCSKGIQ